MEAVQVHVAGGNQKTAVDQIHNPVGEIGGEVGAVVGAAVFFQAAGDVHTRVALGRA